MKIAQLDLSSIDFDDKTFLVGNKENLSFVQSSIQEIGLLNPPILRSSREKYQIISGWKRILSSRELGFAEILCKIYDSSELTDNDCLKIIFYDNKDNFSDLELSELIRLFKDLGFLEDKELISDILPLLQIPPNRKNLDKYLGLASLDRVIKDAYYEAKITVEQCQMLSELTSNNHIPMLNLLLLKYNLNNNESKQVISDIEEITLRDKRPINHIIDEIESTMSTDSSDKKVSKNEFRSFARVMRFPELSKVQKKFDDILKALSLPKNMSISHHPYFETNELEIRLKIKSSEELSETIKELDENCTNGEIDRLISLITKGK